MRPLKEEFAMKFFFDESGSFRVPGDRQEHAVGIVVGVVVPENGEADLFQRFHQFTDKLPRSAFKDNEPKGSLLDDKGRRSFAVLVSESDGCMVCPTILDLTSMAGRAVEIRNKIVTKLNAWATQCKYETMRREVDLLGRQVGNLSPVAAFRLAAWAQCIKRCIADSIIAHSGREFHDCWTDVTFEIDAVQPKAASREQQVFTNMLPAWVTAWCQRDPFTLIEEIHTEDHPFVRRWDTERGIDLGKMFRGNVRFSSSHISLGLQIADMASSVVRRAVAGLVSAYDLSTYGLMLKGTLRSSTHAHGLFSFAELNETDIARRFQGLVEAVEHARG
jgi:hypothetical protein